MSWSIPSRISTFFLCHLNAQNQQDAVVAAFTCAGLTDVLLDRLNVNACSSVALVMAVKNNKAAQFILQIESKAVLLYVAHGRNFLHSDVMKNSLESVLFLSINVTCLRRSLWPSPPTIYKMFSMAWKDVVIPCSRNVNRTDSEAVRDFYR